MLLTILLATLFTTIGQIQETEVSELPPRNENVIRLLDEAAVSIDRIHQHNHPAFRALILGYLDAGDFDRALASLLRNQEKLNYPILDMSYHISKSDRVKTANRLIQGFYASQGVDIFESSLHRATQERFKEMINQFELPEILDWIHRFQLESARLELIAIGIRQTASRGRLDFARRLAEEPGAEKRLDKWAGEMGTALAQNGDVIQAQRLSTSLLDRMKQLEHSDEPNSAFQRCARDTSRVLAAIAVQQTLHGQKASGETNFRLAHSIAPVPVDQLVEGKRFDLTMELYEHTVRDLVEPVLAFGNPQARYRHVLISAAERTDDLGWKVKLVLAISQPELRLPGIIKVLRFIEKISADERDASQLAEILAVRERLHKKAFICLEEMDIHSFRLSGGAVFAEYLFDIDRIDTGLNAISEFSDEGDWRHDSLSPRGAAAAIRFGHIEQGLSILEECTCPYGGCYRSVVKAMAEAGMIESIPDVLSRTSDEEEFKDAYEVNIAVGHLSRHYPWADTWEFAKQQYGESFNPYTSTYIFQQVAKQEGPDAALKAYRFMREQDVDGYFYLLKGLTENGNLQLASQIVLELINDPPPLELQHKIPNKHLLVEFLADKDEFEKAWELVFHLTPAGDLDTLRPLFQVMLEKGHKDRVETFMDAPFPAKLSARDVPIHKSVRTLALAQATLQVASEN